MVGDRRLDVVLASALNRSVMRTDEAMAMSAAVHFVARAIQVHPGLKKEFETQFGCRGLETILEMVEEAEE